MGGGWCYDGNGYDVSRMGTHFCMTTVTVTTATTSITTATTTTAVG